jgi:DNA-binding NtrC family response regulator
MAIMKKVKGKIILVDDDAYEETFLNEALKKNDWHIKVEYFNNADDALEHLKQNADEVFLIISDIDMPRKNGLEFKRVLDGDAYLRQKSIPFIFMSNSAERDRVIDAYKCHVQGFFPKPMTPGEQASMFETIVQYWIACLHPTKDDLPENPNLTRHKNED